MHTSFKYFYPSIHPSLIYLYIHTLIHTYIHTSFNRREDFADSVENKSLLWKKSVEAVGQDINITAT
jgi:hypothetical protein